MSSTQANQADPVRSDISRFARKQEIDDDGIQPLGLTGHDVGLTAVVVLPFRDARRASLTEPAIGVTGIADFMGSLALQV